MSNADCVLDEKIICQLVSSYSREYDEEELEEILQEFGF